MKKNINKIIISIFAIITVVMLFFFFKDIIFEIIDYMIKEDVEGMKKFVQDKGLWGTIMLVLIQAFQMVVVFISAEFVQISAGLVYPWYFAILLCDIGVCLGAAIIFILVRTFKFDSSIFKKTNNRISRYKRGRNTQIIMYCLFIMPLVPFGAICYFGANNKISFRRYMLTCSTGVIPSIISSIFIGRIISYAIVENIPFWEVVLFIVLVVIVLLLLDALLLYKLVLKKDEKTPYSIFYSIILRLYRYIIGKKIELSFDRAGLDKIEGPYVLLTNHPSFFDSFCSYKLVSPNRPTFILNRYYFRNKLFKYVLEQSGTIPKKLFSPDLDTIKKTIKAVKNGYSIYMCPEGRLGVDGTSYYITKETGKFVKQLKLPIVIASINGAYLVKPKWRKHSLKGKVHVKITSVLTKEDVLSLSVDEINNIINEGISYNDFDFAKENGLVYKDKKKAEGLENVLYHCPCCHKEFNIETKGNIIKCNDCGFSLEIDDNYQFSNNDLNIKNVHDWYQMISEEEVKEIEKGINLSCEVLVKKFNMSNKKLDEQGSGVCTLSNSEFTFKGDLSVKEFSIDIDNLKALAFSCGEEFECYYNDELYYFYPTVNKTQCAKWALIVDKMVKDS